MPQNATLSTEMHMKLPTYRSESGRLRSWQQQQGQAVAQANKPKMAEEPVTVVTGALPIFGHLACTLFDSCSTHSFISVRFAEQALLGLKPLENVLLVSMSLEKFLKITHVL